MEIEFLLEEVVETGDGGHSVGLNKLDSSKLIIGLVGLFISMLLLSEMWRFSKGFSSSWIV